MGLSEIPLPPAENPGNDLPSISGKIPGAQSRTWLTRFANAAAPMGPRPGKDERVVRVRAPDSIVLASGLGSNLFDVDANRYVDLAAGFGSMLLGHSHPAVLRALEMQSGRLLQSLGDVYTSDAKIGLLERLARLYPEPDAKVILGQSGADAISAAMKTATLATGRKKFISFDSSYHGLSYGPLSITNLRAGYVEPFSGQLVPSEVLPYPGEEDDLGEFLAQLERLLASESFAALVVEPILGRGGVLIPPQDMMKKTVELCHRFGTLVICDEIWTGLGRAGSWLFSQPSVSLNQVPQTRSELEEAALAGDAKAAQLLTERAGLADIICLGKGLGGGIPISATIGSSEVMQAWSQEDEVVHTSTFAGAPLACTAALATLDILSRKHLVERSEDVGGRFFERLADTCEPFGHFVRAEGMMLAIELRGPSSMSGQGAALQRRLLTRGYITSTGGGARDTLVLTPALTIEESLLEAFCDELSFCLMSIAR